MRRVVSLFLPSWPTDRLRRHGNGPLETPLLLAERQGSKRLVTAVDAAARALGIAPGMAVTQAQAMHPGLAVQEAALAEDAAGLRRLAAWCLRHVSPLAAPCPPDGVWIDTTGTAHLFGGEAALLARLARRLARAGIASRAAIADTPGAAHALARYAEASCHVDPPGGAAQSLRPLPVAALRLPEETVAALRRLGFDTVGQLMAAPRAPLAKRFGALVARRLDQALGAVREPVEPLLVEEIPRSRMGFAEPIATPEDLTRAATLLTERVCEKLLHKGLGARQLDLVFTRMDGVTQHIRAGTSAATRDAAHIGRLLRDKIETIDPGFGIEMALLAASRCDALCAHQAVSELAAAKGGGDLSFLVDTLSNRLGENRVFRLAPVESDIPERSVRRLPPLSRDTGDDWPEELPRPPRLVSPPQKVQVLALLPDHAPKHFLWGSRRYQVRRADGPERIFGEWWKGSEEEAAVRDYFSVEDEAGQRFWLFRQGNGEDGRTGDLSWFLHGVFG